MSTKSNLRASIIQGKETLYIPLSRLDCSADLHEFCIHIGRVTEMTTWDEADPGRSTAVKGMQIIYIL